MIVSLLEIPFSLTLSMMREQAFLMGSHLSSSFEPGRSPWIDILVELDELAEVEANKSSKVFVTLTQSSVPKTQSSGFSAGASFKSSLS